MRLSGNAFGTTWSVVFVSAHEEPKPKREELEARVHWALDRVDALMSAHREDSEIVRFNESGNLEPFRFDPETRKVVAAALDYARDSKGAFDPTVGPLVRLWGFGPGAEEEYPERAAVEEARERVGWSLLFWDDEGRLVRRTPGVELDLSGIAKGYGVDAVMQALARYRPAGLLVEIGGDLRVMGVRPSGEPWRLGIQSPAGGLDSKILMTRGALATSGDYRQSRGDGEKRRTHIIDPRTGRPAPDEVTSASVVAPTALEADAVATALVVMGVDEAMSYVEARPWLEAMVMTREKGEKEASLARASSGWPIEDGMADRETSHSR